MAWGIQGVDWELRVDYDRMRKDRLARARAQMEKAGLGALLCMDPNNVRYLTSTHLGEWSRDKFTRYCVLPKNGDPVLFDFGSAVKTKKLYNPWIADHVRPAVGWMRGAVPQLESASDRFMKDILEILSEHGVEKEPLGIDLADATLLKALQKSNLEVTDGQDVMLEARLRKSPDEIQLLKAAAAMADGAYESIARAIRPGVKENEIVAVANDALYRLGSEDVECVNVVSGPRTNPHPHVFSDRIVRPGDLVFIDIMHAFNGYRTCYYRTFVCGRPSTEQLRVYRQTYDWLYAGIAQVRPGVTTADIVKVWPTAQELGLPDEASAFGLQFGHGIGLSIWEKPIVSRLFALDQPYPIEEGMVFALETYCGTPDGKHGARIEEEVVVTANGCEVITRYPCEELISCGIAKYW